MPVVIRREISLLGVLVFGGIIAGEWLTAGLSHFYNWIHMLIYTLAGVLCASSMIDSPASRRVRCVVDPACLCALGMLMHSRTVVVPAIPSASSMDPILGRLPLYRPRARLPRASSTEPHIPRPSVDLPRGVHFRLLFASLCASPRRTGVRSDETCSCHGVPHARSLASADVDPFLFRGNARPGRAGQWSPRYAREHWFGIAHAQRGGPILSSIDHSRERFDANAPSEVFWTR